MRMASSGISCDCGSKSGYLQATVAFGMAREDLREEFEEFLRGYLQVDVPKPAMRAV